MTREEKIKHNAIIRERLFLDADSFTPTTEQVERVALEIAKRMRADKSGNTPITINKNGKEVFVGWCSSWRFSDGIFYQFTTMGYSFHYGTNDINTLALWVCQMCYARKHYDYDFIYGL